MGGDEGEEVVEEDVAHLCATRWWKSLHAADMLGREAGEEGVIGGEREVVRVGFVDQGVGEDGMHVFTVDGGIVDGTEEGDYDGLKLDEGFDVEGLIGEDVGFLGVVGFGVGSGDCVGDGDDGSP